MTTPSPTDPPPPQCACQPPPDPQLTNMGNPLNVHPTVGHTLIPPHVHHSEPRAVAFGLLWFVLAAGVGLAFAFLVLRRHR